MVNNYQTTKNIVQRAEPQINKLLDDATKPFSRNCLYRAGDAIASCLKYLEKAEEWETGK